MQKPPSSTTSSSEALAAAIDLDQAPYSSRFSRLLVLSEHGMSTWAGRELPDGEGAQALTVLRSSYERRAADSVVIDGLRVVRNGKPAGWLAGADGIRFDSGARLVVGEGDRLVLSGLGAGDIVEMTPGTPAEEGALWASTGSAMDRLRVEGRADTDWTDTQVRVRAEGEAAFVWDTVPAAPRSVSELVEDHDRELASWMARSPAVLPERRAMTDLCWWVLGNNTLTLHDAQGTRVVVPSKLGYVGLWQWDAYFIALGLRHGDPELAAEQMGAALTHAGADGQLPDVVHDEGVLASSSDLPPGDLENLRRLGSPSLDGDHVPLTKPPLTALTLQMLSAELGREIIDRHLETVLASQEWWFAQSDPGAKGWPAYLHPYSSGLDDSPVFDHNAILRSPDLAAYLVVQDRILARWLGERGRGAEAEKCLERGHRLRTLLEETWDPGRELFVLEGENSEVTTRSILNLIALLIPGLRGDIRDALMAQVTDPRRFGGRWLLPTVARDDPDFSPERMWRGPIWVNTAWLVSQGLRVHGETELADWVMGNLLDLVTHAGGPSEYFNPDVGRKARTATVLFGWSSALFVEMAVGEALQTKR